jgi:mono/diheme cytochrome c family protein
VIDVGRGLMPPYGHRMTHADRWAVVSYLRQLQGTSGPAPAPQETPAAGAADTAAAAGAAGVRHRPGHHAELTNDGCA